MPSPVPNLMPGELIAPANAIRPETFSVLRYTPDTVEEAQLDNAEALKEMATRGGVLWVNLDGLGNVNLVRALGNALGLHPLALEDALTPHGRPKLEDYPEHLFLVTRILHWKPRRLLETEQTSVFLRPPYVITIQERPGDCLDGIRSRIRKNAGNLRRRDAGFLFYAILDAAVDQFFPKLEKLRQWLDALEDEVVYAPKQRSMERIHFTKRALLRLQRAVWPLREALNRLVRDGNRFITDDIRLYLRDCADHTMQVLEVTETYREIASGLMDMYLSSLSNRMNQIMTVLTVFSTVFIPLTFITGVYGMNFENMPELHWRYGYTLVWLLMLIVAAGLLVSFYLAGWIGHRKD